MQIDDRFVARGNAVALAGYVSRMDENNVDKNLPIPNASCSLPVTGGASESSHRNFAFPSPDNPAISLSACRARAWHENRGGTHVTQTEVEIKGLQIGRRPRLFVESARVAMRSEHPPRVSVPTIEVVSPRSLDLKLDDHTLRVSLNPEISAKYRTKDELRNAYERDADFHKRLRHCFLTCGDDRGEARHLVEFRGSILVSLVEKTEWVGDPHPDAKTGGLKITGHVIEWKGFGKIILAEMFVSELSRRLTLIRTQLGSPINGSMSGCEVESNGVLFP